MFTAAFVVFWSCVIFSVGGVLADYLLPLIFAWHDKKKGDKNER